MNHIIVTIFWRGLKAQKAVRAVKICDYVFDEDHESAVPLSASESNLTIRC